MVNIASGLQNSLRGIRAQTTKKIKMRLGNKLFRWAQYLIVITFIIFTLGIFLIDGPDLKTIENDVEDLFERAHSVMNQWSSIGSPSFSNEKKMMLGRWEFPHDGCVVAKECFLAVGMRVPKAASSTLQDLVEGLAKQNNYAMSMVIQRHGRKQVNRSDEEQRLVRYLSALNKRTVHTAHVPFLNFGPLGFPRPVYFSTIRDPFKRLSSHYDYEHFGPRPLYVRLVHQDTTIPSFEQCIEGHMINPNLKKKDYFDCLQTAGLQIRFYCGISDACRQTSISTLQTAIQNIEKNFAAVVVVEEMMLSFKVLEAVLPNLFKGLVRMYHKASGGGEGVHLRTNNAAKSSKGLVSQRHLNFIMKNPNLQLEYGLYNFTKARLHRQVLSCGIDSS